MVTKSEQDTSRTFIIDARALLEAADEFPSHVPLSAYAFTRTGLPLAETPLSNEGEIKLEFSIRGAETPQDIELLVAPQGETKAVYKSSAFRHLIGADEWQDEDGQFVFRSDFIVAKVIWLPWLPKWICISGHVRKLLEDNGISTICPVPFTKVEIFDVDREFCWWPFLRRWWDVILDKRVLHVPELLKERQIEVRPLPEPDPVPHLIRDIGPIPAPALDVNIAAINPRSEPPVTLVTGVNPQPEPSFQSTAQLGSQAEPLDQLQLQTGASNMTTMAFERVGETARLSPRLAARFDHLTLNSKIAPWLIFPWCFYSTQKICETTTDENGYFRCCFWWWPFHFRRGRLRFDAKPDIIIKVTQVVDGVERVLYLDPYTSTRWNVTNAHIDLWLDDESIVCGSGDEQERPPGAQVFLTRIGDDEVYNIDQATGLYNSGSYTNVAYGHMLRVYAQFGDQLSDGGNLPGKYYRLSYAKSGSPDSAFTPITIPLNDTRVSKATNFSESHNLGPHTVNTTAALYEIRDTLHYLWYNPDLIGRWYSWLAEQDTGKYVLRLEVFDHNGNKVNSPDVDYRDGTATPNGVLPAMTDHADLIITLDNKAPVLDLGTPAVNDCGVIPWDVLPPLNLQVSVTQENNRLYYWRLEYTKGVQPPPPHTIAKDLSYAGSLNPVNVTIDAMNYPNPFGGTPAYLNMLEGVDTSCAFALKLLAWPHIRNGRHFIYYREVVKAIAIEKCNGGS